ncbi:MAG: hypothetical protein ACXVED_07425, partial [Bacteroidia bacterium]
MHYIYSMRRNILILLTFIFSFHCVFSQTQGLDSYIQTGLQNSPLLKDYQNQLQASSLDSVLINAQRKPQVSAIGQLL